MGPVSSQINQGSDNTKSTVVKPSGDSDAFAQNIESSNELIAHMPSNLDMNTLNSSRYGPRNKTNDDKTLPSLPDQKGSDARSSKQSSNTVFDLGFDFYSKVDEMTDISKITRLWTKKVPGACLYPARLGAWEEKCHSWWLFFYEYNTKNFKLETWIEARTQNVVVIQERTGNYLKDAWQYGRDNCSHSR